MADYNMKILHVCMNNPYIDGWGYQENLLPRYLSREGIQSVVVSSDILPKQYLNGYKYKVGQTIDEDNVKVIRIKCKRIRTSLTISFGLYKTLLNEKPNIIFHHNPNFTTSVICSLYCMINGIKMIVDNHADYINCVQNKFYQLIFYRILVGGITNLFSYPIIKYYGVTPSRCDFLRNVFCVSSKKIDFLPIGIDEYEVKKIPPKSLLRQKYNIEENSFVVVSGGKMGLNKGTDALIKAIKEINNKHNNVMLILFGKFEDGITEQMAKGHKFIKIEGWCDRMKTLEILKMSDLALWPIHHTTLIEDAIGCGTPILIRKTRTTEHLIKGNGHFMDTGSLDEIKKYILLFLSQSKESKELMNMAIQKQQKRLSYKTIAKKIKDLCLNYI